MHGTRLSITTALLLFSLSVPCFANETASGETAQSLYLKAGKLERQGEASKAREAYESVIDRFPASEFAVKANDRLLQLGLPTQPQPASPQQAQPAPPAKTSEEPSLFAPASLPPLPTEPAKRRVAELSRQYKDASHTRSEEYNRHQGKFTTRFGHQFSRRDLADQQEKWNKLADEKVVKEYGMSLADMRKKLDAACQAAGLAAGCDEGDLR